jgi:hypothetical protein
MNTKGVQFRNEQFLFWSRPHKGFAVPANGTGRRTYAAAGNPRRTPSRTKRTIYGWTRVKQHLLRRRQPMTVEFKEDIKALFVKLEKIKDYL